MARRAGDAEITDTAEQKRLNDARQAGVTWKKWGPYLSERQWGTVREDYSPYGDAWDYFTHDQSRSRAYRWGEDGLGGISDDKQRLCFALALWNERDPILKERAFGLTNSEGNHGEDVKEYYFYVDSTPTHSYMKYLYKYPQREFPYRDLIETNRRADAGGVRVRAPRHRDLRRRPLLRRLPRVREGGPGRAPRPRVRAQPRARRRPVSSSFRPCGSGTPGRGETKARSRPCARTRGPSWPPIPSWATTRSACDGAPELLFTENESNTQKLWGQPSADALRQGRVPPVRDLRRE